MTKHTITNLLFGVALVSLILVHTQTYVSFGWYIALFLLYNIVIILGTYFIGLHFFMYSYCRGDQAKAQIAITFDDGPKSPATAQILDILKKENVPATFFLIGRNIAHNENIVQRINDEGHLIGSHSFYHHWRFPLQSAKKIEAEISQSQNAISMIIRKKPLLFRPPFGVTDPPLAKAVRQTGVHSIGWSLRSYDTVISSPEKLLDKVKKVRNGDVILFHEAGLQTNVILPVFIEYVRAKGIEIVPLDQLLGITAYEN